MGIKENNSSLSSGPPALPTLQAHGAVERGLKSTLWLRVTGKGRGLPETSDIYAQQRDKGSPLHARPPVLELKSVRTSEWSGPIPLAEEKTMEPGA